MSIQVRLLYLLGPIVTPIGRYRNVNLIGQYLHPGWRLSPNIKRERIMSHYRCHEFIKKVRDIRNVAISISRYTKHLFSARR